MAKDREKEDKNKKKDEGTILKVVQIQMLLDFMLYLTMKKAGL